MSEPSAGEPLGPRPRIGTESAGLADDDSRYTNAARALALGVMLSGRRDALEGIGADIASLGVPSDLRRPTTWGERSEAIQESGDVLRQLNAGELIESERVPRRGPADRSVEPRFADQRVQVWSLLSQNSQSVPYAYAWLRLLMAEHDPLLSASASSALSHWRRPAKESESNVPVTLRTAKSNVDLFVDDSDTLVNEIAQATVGAPSANAANRETKLRRLAKKGEYDELSLLIHGTHAFTGRWWFPGGDFHSFVQNNVRSNVYDQADTFWWSGRYKAKDRKFGAERLVGWHAAKGSPEMDTVLAHSYGGAVALQATALGLKIKNLVLLSAPVDNYEVEWRNIGRAVSLRIHCDLVLLAARTKQCFTANVDENWIDSWFVSHSMSHDPGLWIDDEWAAVLGLDN